MLMEVADGLAAWHPLERRLWRAGSRPSVGMGLLAVKTAREAYRKRRPGLGLRSSAIIWGLALGVRMALLWPGGKGATEVCLTRRSRRPPLDTKVTAKLLLGILDK